MTDVFICYSHQDETWKNHLEGHLKVLANETKLRYWDDRKIELGDTWRAEIDAAIGQARVAVILVSKYSLTSDFIRRHELPRLLEKHDNGELVLVPLIVSPCPWPQVESLASLQVHPKDGRPLLDMQENEWEHALNELAVKSLKLLNASDGDKGRSLNPPRVSLAHLAATGGAIFGRETELATLDEAWRNPKTRILSLVAWGGVGKTALVNHWLDQIADRDWEGAARVYGWSFYSQGAGEDRQASADTFFNESLAWFGDPDPSGGSPWDKGERLAQLVAAQPTLLVLDGLEPLQHPSGEIAGELKDPGMKAMLRELARLGKGLCLISSRLPLSDLSHHEAGAAPRVALGHLSAEAGAKVLAHLGVKGPEAELVQVAAEYGGHALALNLLGHYLKAIHEGDIRRRDKIPSLMNEKIQGGHARRVMASYEEIFTTKPKWKFLARFKRFQKPKAEADILRLLGLFDRPAEVEAVAALRAEPPIAGLTDRLSGLDEEGWAFALSRLRDLGLLAEERPDGTLDCHPLVREHFAGVLEMAAPEAFRAGHDRLYDYYRGMPEKEQPDTLAEMEPLFRAVHHGCRAGRHQHALDEVFSRRINRRSGYAVYKIGEFGSILAALAAFFVRPWREPAAGLPPAAQAWVLSCAGFGLRALGRLHEAAQPMDASIELRVEQKNYEEAAKCAGNLSELYLTLGRVAEAVAAALRAVAFADQSEDLFQKMGKRATAGDALLQAGEQTEAAERFKQAEAIQQE